MNLSKTTSAIFGFIFGFALSILFITLTYEEKEYIIKEKVIEIEPVFYTVELPDLDEVEVEWKPEIDSEVE